MNDNRIFRASEIDTHKTGWVADLSGPDAVNPDCYWYFATRNRAARFLEMVDDGMDSEAAYAYIITEQGRAAAERGKKWNLSQPS